MWLLGFSTGIRRQLLVMGGIVLVILLTLILKKLAIYLEARAQAQAQAKLQQLELELEGGGAGAGAAVTTTTTSRRSTLLFTKNIDHGQYQYYEYDQYEQQRQLVAAAAAAAASRKSSSLCCIDGTDNYYNNGVNMIRTYAVEEMRVATRDFRVRIGVGATSLVYLAELGDGKLGAVKRVVLMETNKSTNTNTKANNNNIFLDELSVLLRISHPNLVRLLGFCLDKGEQLLVLEYVPNKSLFERMHTYHGQSWGKGILSWSNRLSIALDVARALDYLHSKADPPIIHRDVKSSNVLLVDDNRAKLADFGLCKLGPNQCQTDVVKGSFGYVDPYYLKTGLVSPKSDVYSFGVLLLELITGLKSTQGSLTLAEWTHDCRKRNNNNNNTDHVHVDVDVDVEAQLLDPKLNGHANLDQLRVLLDLANAALLENPQRRPDMTHFVHTIFNCISMHPHPHPHPHHHPPLPV